jgi:hypothetical protein
MAATVLVSLVGFGVFGFGAMAARPRVNSTTYVLRGTGQFNKAVASAIVTRLSGDQFRLSLTAEHLPPPTLLHVKFARHAYVAWLVHGDLMHGPMHIAAVGLVSTQEQGSYTGQGTVAISGVTSVIITAEPTTQAHMPILPALTVLACSGHQM